MLCPPLLLGVCGPELTRGVASVHAKLLEAKTARVMSQGDFLGAGDGIC
jgi:hypothetical protein